MASTPILVSALSTSIRNTPSAALAGLNLSSSPINCAIPPGVSLLFTVWVLISRNSRITGEGCPLLIFSTCALCIFCVSRRPEDRLAFLTWRPLSKLSVILLNTPVMPGRMFTRGRITVLPSATSSLTTSKKMLSTAFASVSVTSVPRFTTFVYQIFQVYSGV